MSWPATLYDDAEAFAEAVVSADPEVAGPTVTVEAPCCGRRCAADMVVDLRSVAGTTKDWACDGCRWRMIRTPGNGWSRSRLYRALGAPIKDVKLARAKEIVLKRSRQSPDPFVEHDAMQEVLSNLPQGEYPNGTEPPS